MPLDQAIVEHHGGVHDALDRARGSPPRRDSARERQRRRHRQRPTSTVDAADAAAPRPSHERRLGQLAGAAGQDEMAALRARPAIPPSPGRIRCVPPMTTCMPSASTGNLPVGRAVPEARRAGFTTILPICPARCMSRKASAMRSPLKTRYGSGTSSPAGEELHQVARTGAGSGRGARRSAGRHRRRNRRGCAGRAAGRDGCWRRSRACRVR